MSKKMSMQELINWMPGYEWIQPIEEDIYDENDDDYEIFVLVFWNFSVLT